MTVQTHISDGEKLRNECLSAKGEKAGDVKSRIWSLYNAGVPFFTKVSIQDLDRQLEKDPKRGQRVTVKGLDGTVVDFEIETGLIHSSDEPDFEMLVGAPCIGYVPIQSLVSDGWNGTHRTAYCNLQIRHRLHERNVLTGEIMGEVPTRSLEAVAESFKATLHAWESGEPCKQLRSALASTTLPCRISKLVGFACGSMATSSHEQQTTRRAFQHALLVTLVRFLGSESGSEVACYVQDPQYKTSDKTVLETYGITTLDDPKAFLEVDDATVVFSCSPDVPVKQVVLDLTRPAVMIWNRVCEQDPDIL
ncbi:MAG: hypothetical protein M1822_005282, partial [Bathelium mastoideum]